MPKVKQQKVVSENDTDKIVVDERQKIIPFYSLAAGGGGFAVVCCQVDINSGKVISVDRVSDPDVLYVALKNLQKYMRKDLGI